jgi:hypothetical protein
MSGQPLLSGEIETNWIGVKRFYCFVTFGSSAVSTVQTREIVSFVRNSAGNYTVTFPRYYRQLCSVGATLIDASGAVIFPVVATNSIDTAGTIVMEMRTETGTATDVDSGSKVMFVFEVSNEPFNDNTI